MTSSERYEILGIIGRDDITNPQEIAGLLNRAGLALIAEYDDTAIHPHWVIARYEEVPSDV